MSTRGVIARLGGVHPPQFCGRYHHWDSYPSGLGHTLWDLYHEQFGCDLEAMLRVLIDQHPAGWSTLNGADFRMEPGFTELAGSCAPQENPGESASRKENAVPAQGQRPECYCHGDRAEAAWEVTKRNAAGSGCEWAYAFVRGQTAQRDIMVILSSFLPSGRKMIGYFGQGDPKSVWAVVAVIGLQGPEPDWEALNGEALNHAAPLERLGSLKPSADTNGFQRRASSRTPTKPDARDRSRAQERQCRDLQYRGQRLTGKRLADKGAVVFVWEADKPALLSPARNQRLVKGAESFGWGDEGSGSARLALAILFDFTADEELAVQYHQRFQRQVVAPIARDEPFWCLTAQQIHSFLESCLGTIMSGDVKS